jgi:protein tyrosine phosphatase (PTP) superfamily phosphohydrolase (DUF442 family)
MEPRDRITIIIRLLLYILVLFSPRKTRSSPPMDDNGFEAGIFDVGAAFVSGQPTEDALRRYAKQGVTTVVSVRTQEEMDDRKAVPFDEPALLKELKVKYVHIPMGPCSPALVKQFAEAMDNAHGKLLLHCTVAWRATYMWMAYLISYRHYSVDDAWKAGMQMSVTVDRSAMMLDSDVSYTATPHRDGARKPKEGVLSKPGSKLKITSPRVMNAPTGHWPEFVMWDLGDIFNAAQPDEKRLRELAAQGVKTIVNLRAPQEMEALKKRGFDEEAVAKELGMKYVNVPISGWQTFTPAKLTEIAEAFEHAEGRILYHCQSASRTTQALVPYLVKYQGMSLDEATKVGESMRWTNMLPELLGADFSCTLKAKAAPGH